jgi:flagellar biosynthesis protein FliQ
MEISNVIDWSRGALRMALLLGGPPLAAAVVVGLVIGMIQTMTQMHEPIVAQAPRLVVILLVVLIALPWLVSRWVAYAVEMIGAIPEMI